MSGTNNNTNIIKSTHCTLSQWRNTTSSNSKHYKAISTNPQLRHPSKNKLKPKAKTMANFLTDVREILAREIKSLSISAKDAEALIKRVEKTIHSEYAGQPVYINKRVKNNLRNSDIYKKFTGSNIGQLCRDYDLCAQQIRRIVKSQRLLSQSDIFGY